MVSLVPARDRISASVDIAAGPEQVWSLVSDLRRMGAWSPQCHRMFVLGGAVRVGTRTINLNRRGWLVWPTQSRVTTFDAPRVIEFKIPENGTRWRYELEPTDTGTRLTESRLAPGGVTRLSARLQDALLGGQESFEAELQAGIELTLAKIKAECEVSR